MLGLLLSGHITLRAEATWQSEATGRAVALEWFEPAGFSVDEKTPLPVVFYLTNLTSPRVGTENDEVIISDLRHDGFLVVVLDYARDPRARMPDLARDFVALRGQLQRKAILADRAVDPAHVFIVPAGCRLQRDVVFYRDAGRTLAMDIIYPSNPVQPVGAVLEFSCDNANRMGNFSLDFCTDVLLAGAATEGFIAAMADHPVAAPYQGFDAMPESAWKIKAAVRTLRAAGGALGSNDRIVAAGFSRGSGMALMLATTTGRSEFEGHGEHRETASTVQGAVVMSGRFTYLDLLPSDKMIPRYEKTWGSRARHEDIWRAHGALDYLQKATTVPLFLTINASESADARHQMDVLRHRLTELHSQFIYQPELKSRGHKMPLDPTVLDSLFDYLHQRLDSPSGVTTVSP